MSGYAFYPGCSLESTARDYGLSTMAVSKALEIELREIEDWICCGSTPAHQSNPLLSLALPAKSLRAAAGKDVAVCCAACYSRLKIANHKIAADAAKRQQVAEVIGSDYDGHTPVKHMLEILVRDFGVKQIAAKIRQPLRGLKVACYYGCLLSRPPEITCFDDPENPTLMDQVCEIAGAEALDWSHKTECCGSSFSVTNVDIVLRLTGQILDAAKQAGADCIVAACGLCQLNLDLRQKDVEAKTGQSFNLPVLYFTQLLGLALGLSQKELGLNSLVVDVKPLLAAKGITTR
jgi:heterodisulfide reductase subunit B2